MGLEPTSRRATTCFQDRFLIRPDAFRLQAAGAGIEPTSRRSERPVLPLDDPAEGFCSRHLSERVRSHKVRETRRLVVRGWAPTPTATTPDGTRVPCGNRTRLASLEGWSLCRSAKGTCCEAEREGVEPSRPLGSSGFQPGPVTDRVALPFRCCLSAARPGLEPGTPR